MIQLKEREGPGGGLFMLGVGGPGCLLSSILSISNNKVHEFE